MMALEFGWLDWSWADLSGLGFHHSVFLAFLGSAEDVFYAMTESNREDLTRPTQANREGLTTHANIPQVNTGHMAKVIVKRLEKHIVLMGSHGKAVNVRFCLSCWGVGEEWRSMCVIHPHCHTGVGRIDTFKASSLLSEVGQGRSVLLGHANLA